MTTEPRLPFPIKALASLGSITSGAFASCLATIVTGGSHALANADARVLIGTTAFGGLIGLFNWIKSSADRHKAEVLAALIQQNANDTLTALQLITDIAKRNLKLPVEIDDNFRAEIEEACRRAIESEQAGLSQEDFVKVYASIQELATSDQLEALKADFDEFQEISTMLLWTQDHRGREHETILLDIQRLVVDVAARCPSLIHLEVKIDRIDERTARTDATVQRMAESLNRRLNETDEQVAERLRPIIEADVASRVRTEFEQQLHEKDETIDRLTRSAVRAASVPGLIETLRKTGDARKIFEALREVSTHTDADFIEVHRGIAEWAYLTGAVEDSERSLKNILHLLPDDRDALNRMGQVRQLRGDFPEAEGYFQRVLELSSDDPTWQAIALGNLGSVSLESGDLDQGESRQLRALEIDLKQGRLRGMAVEYSNLGLIAYLRDKLDVAWAMHQESLKIHHRLKNLPGVASCLGNLGLIQMSRKQYDAALDAISESLAAYQALHHALGICTQSGNLGIVHLRLGNDELAIACIETHLRLAKELGRIREMARSHFKFGNVYKDRRDFDKTSQHWSQAQTLFHSIKDDEGLHTVMAASMEVFIDRLQKGDILTIPIENVDPNPKVPNPIPHPE